MSRSRRAPLVAIIEQDAGVVGLLEVLLQAEGFRTVRATEEEIGAGPDRLTAFLDRHDPQVVLYDIALPYDGSWQVFRQVHTVARLKGRRFVLLATDLPWVAKRVDSVGSPEVIEKPFEVEALVQAVHTALHQQ